MMGDKYTRTFRNLHYLEISGDDFDGPRTMIANQYKLVIESQSNDGSNIELFDLIKDPAEQINVAAVQPEIVEDMQRQLHDWQQSVLESLTGGDYQ